MKKIQAIGSTPGSLTNSHLNVLKFFYVVDTHVCHNHHIVTGPVPRGGGDSRAVPPKSLLVPPKRELCPPKQGLCPEESNKLGAIGVLFEA